jgi:hypothetical protein
VAEYGWATTSVKAGLRPPPSAAGGLDRACHAAIVCHQEFDGEPRLPADQGRADDWGSRFALEQGQAGQIAVHVLACPKIKQRTRMRERALSRQVKHRSVPRSDRDTRGRFLTGNIGGPGRPVGSRNQLGEEFVAAMLADWTEHGAAVLEQVRSTSPVAYLRVIASLVPQRLAIDEPPGYDLSRLTDGELVFLRRLLIKASMD